jgi:hypothetical protein
MGTGYTRNDTANNIADGNVINASDLDGEFDAIQSAFNGTTGHSHDGTTGEGPQIDTAGIADNAVTLGTKTSGNYVAAGAVSGVGLSGSASAEGATFTVTSNATNANTASTIVSRDASGNFSAGTITAALSGNATTATTLATARTIAGQSFDGSANISIAPTDLTGVTASAAELNLLDGVTATTAELNLLDGVTATTAELNFVDGVTSNIQTQIDNINTDLLNDTTPQLGGDLQSNGNDIDMADNDKIIAGTGSDFEIFHNGTNTILENKTGDFLLRTQGSGALKIQDSGGNNMATFADNGAVTLMHNTNTRLATSSNGVDVTGSVYASGNIGLDTGDYIAWSNNTQLDFYVNGANDMRLESDGDLHVEGDVVAFSTTIASDPRLKENVEQVTDAVAKVEQLTGYTFDYKHGGASAGVMSTDVAQVLPSAVTQTTLPLKTGDEETEYDVVAYDQLHALLIEAVKELSARVKELENGSNG